jgi:putrescine aminotransferase
MSAVSGHELVIESGHGSYVRSVDGVDYLDATAALWYCSVGHGRREIADAVARQMSTIAAYSNFGDTATKPTIELADRLAAMAPMEDAKIFFTSGGSDGVDTAFKLVRRYWVMRGQPSRTQIISRTRAYHGMHLSGTALAGIPANREGYGPLDENVSSVPWDDAQALAEAIDTLGAENVAAFYCEPVIGAGGVYPPPSGYLKAVREICRERGVLFVADEVITGYGRTGVMFASQGIAPDVMITAKGLTSGYLPMGAVFVSGEVAEPFWNTPGALWRHGYTYSGHASVAAAAMANLDIIENEDLVATVASSALTLSAAIAPLRAHDYVVALRSGTGLLAAVQLRPELLADDTTLMPRVIAGLRRRGILTRGLADGSVQISPPFIITRDELNRIAAAIDESLVDVGSRRATAPDVTVDLLPDVTSDESGGFGSSDERLLADVPPHHGS